MKTISPAIFDYFKKLTNSNESDRLTSGLQLIQHISKSQQDEKVSGIFCVSVSFVNLFSYFQRDKEIQYTLKRLVRGVGASTTDSKAGFFTTLVGFLKSVSTDDVSVKDLLAMTKKELHVGGIIVNKVGGCFLYS